MRTTSESALVVLLVERFRPFSFCSVRRHRGFLVALSSNGAIISGFVGSSIVSVLVIAICKLDCEEEPGGFLVLTAFHSPLASLADQNKPSDGIWRICMGIGAVVSPLRAVQILLPPRPHSQRSLAVSSPQMPLIIFFFRMRLMNSTQYQKHAIQNRKVSPLPLLARSGFG